MQVVHLCILTKEKLEDGFTLAIRNSPLFIHFGKHKFVISHLEGGITHLNIC